MALLCLLPVLSLAADSRELAGRDGCRMDNTTGRDDVKPTWSGACRDGLADGRGILEWHDPTNKVVSHYEGELKAGQLHGDGYLRLDDGTQYEGGFAEGKVHGKGTLLDMSGRYDGEFSGGVHSGHGKIVFELGGRYSGQWLDGVFHGTGTAVYPSGREVTTQWVNGVRADLVVPTSERPKYRSSPLAHCL